MVITWRIVIVIYICTLFKRNIYVGSNIYTQKSKGMTQELNFSKYVVIRCHFIYFLLYFLFYLLFYVQFYFISILLVFCAKKSTSSEKTRTTSAQFPYTEIRAADVHNRLNQFSLKDFSWSFFR